ncbi:PREDICTED: protein cereblon homolog isoform X3 [Rhagoletis zephyria]|uniref:protein cereblon homolog isoform X2 n=1 Tax=Rhagoletis zephyria TaxID=28612 RepID=UPI000811229C|nr:PREDICTED: protein cereblon homolog isoform X2 [Rhagoletis zephyria]XP_017481449.1 PREDICTED: protein cereblon homolog isoform X3 [Rhagoletis zephyria]
MDQIRPAEPSNLSGATGTATEDQPLNSNEEIVNTNEAGETPPPSEGTNELSRSVSATKPNTTEESTAGLPSAENEAAVQPSATTSRIEHAINENIPQQLPDTESERQQLPDVSTLAVELINDAVAIIQDDIGYQQESVLVPDNDLVPDLEHPVAVAANMEIETEQREVDEVSSDQQPAQGPHSGWYSPVFSVDENEGDGNEEDLRFDPSPLIEPLLEDDDMVEQRDEEDDDEQAMAENEGEDNMILEDISDDASSSSDAVFDNDLMRAAFREMLVQNRRGGENFMQRLRSAFFTMEHNRERRRVEPESSELEIEEPDPENPVTFDTNLPAEHSYLGENMNRVSGVHYLEVGKEYNMMLFMHQHILFPGEVLPFMISGSIIDMDTENGMLFGVCFPILCNREEVGDNFYGVTCQIYEKGMDERGNTLIKSRALQRFVTKGSQVTGPLSFIAAHPQLKVYGYVRILPEIYLREPLKCINMGSLNRYRDIESMSDTYKRYQAATTPWPAHVYDYYSITAIIEKARSQLAHHKIDTMPTDPTQLSFWLVRNLHLSDSLMKTIFLTDSVNIRMKIISNTFTDDSVFTCRYCGNRIANCQQLFAMSKHGVQTQYCNSAGYIHETNTVYQLLPDAITYSGQSSSKFSWFPGYEWHIIVCKICSRHIGWKFKALEPNLVPKSFFGISSSSVRIGSPTPGNTNERAAVFQSLMRLARTEMQ